MKVGDKVLPQAVCIAVICIEDYNNGGWLPKNNSLTKGQIYHVSAIGVSNWGANSKSSIPTKRIQLRHMENIYYPIELFVTQEQWRDNQINQILS